MKTIRFTAFSILFGLMVLVFACKKETNPVAATQTGGKILVTGQDAGTGLKSTLSEQTTVWIEGDGVGIYSEEARTASGGGDAIVNAEFNAEFPTASSTFTGTMYWGTPSTPHTFYAYYPYAPGSDASTVVPVSLEAVQVQSAANNSDHIGALDILVATPATVTSPNNTSLVGNAVNLRYNHLFTILEFQIKGSGPLMAVKLSGSNTLAFGSGTIDITLSTPDTGVAYTIASQTGTTTQAVVMLENPATLTDTYTGTKVYMVINPGPQTGNCIIGLSTDGRTWKYISKAAPPGPSGFLRGTKYVVSVDAADAADIVDPDGNKYSAVQIGYQVWMGSNLKTTKYNDGTAIPNVTVTGDWAALGTGAYCWYNNNAVTYKSTYGALYNWFVVDNNALTKVASNGGKNVCPVGWHVPSTDEWTTLTNYLTNNSYGYEGSGTDIAKSLASTSGWSADGTAGNVGNDQASNNITGFTAVPGGIRYSNGSFYYIGQSAMWWTSSTEYSPTQAWYRFMQYTNNLMNEGYDYKRNGNSVRCLQDPTE